MMLISFDIMHGDITAFDLALRVTCVHQVEISASYDTCS